MPETSKTSKIPKTCETCGFFIPAEHCREELKIEMQVANVEGACGEKTNQVMFIPYISKARFAWCGKWMAPVRKDQKNATR